MYKNYDDILKKRAVEKFFKTNNRAPSRTELLEIVAAEKELYPAVEKVGLSGYDLIAPQFRAQSSVAAENKNRKAMFEDHLVFTTRLKNLQKELEDNFRGFLGSVNRTQSLASKIEARLDNLLLLVDNQDLFAYGIEETFDSQEHIDFTNSTVAIENGFCTLARAGYQKYSFSDFELTTSVQSEKGFISVVNSSSVDALKSIDGSIWDYIVYTKYKTGRVSLVLDIEMRDPSFVSDLRVSLANISVNAKLTVTVLYSLDGSNFTALEPAEQVVDSNSFQINVGRADIKKLKILLSKTVADQQTGTGNQHLYIYSVDAIEIFNDAYTSTKQSVLYAGPYKILNESGSPVLFSKATLDACVIQNPNTSINFYLSQDGNTWYAVNYTGESFGVVTFGSSAFEDSRSAVNSNFAYNAIVEPPVFIAHNAGVDAVLNTVISNNYNSKVNAQSISIKRNIPHSETVYGVASGWFFDAGRDTYKTTVEVAQPEGIAIDFGNSVVLINGTTRQGVVRLPVGQTVIETSALNYKTIPTNLLTEAEVRAADPLYPYNHKYLIEGYVYRNDFAGKKVYPGVGTYYGLKMVYVSPEEFETTTRLDAFTLDKDFGTTYIKVKANKADGSWIEEQFDVKWMVSDSATNNLYVRADLETSDSSFSPKIDHFKVRVI